MTYRISILYPVKPGVGFDWVYYMNRHLPLAVGTSMRHSGLVFCDADKPLSTDTPHLCVCMVHFDNEQSMQAFCNFFVTGHPESIKIGEDEHNYTSIAPLMVCGESVPLLSPAVDADATHRVKVFFPPAAGKAPKRAGVAAALGKLLDELHGASAGVIASELDACTSGIVPGSDPDYDYIWTIAFADAEQASAFAQALAATADLKTLKQVLQAEPLIMTSEIMPFDMALTEPYYRGGRA